MARASAGRYTSPAMRRAGLGLLGIVLVLAPAGAVAQSDVVALARQLARRPDDTGLLCRIGWARFLAGAVPADAAHPLDRAITLLGEPTSPASRVRLAQCLYSSGRVFEAADQPDAAIERYERSLALRPNDVVARRVAEVRARRALAWARGGDELDAAALTDLARAAGTSDPDEVLVHERRVSPDGRAAAVALDVGGAIHLAVREPGAAWSVVRIRDLLQTNGSERASIDVGPAPPGGGGPSFLVFHRWEHRECCDEEGLPDWTEGVSIFLAWRDAAGAWSVVELEASHASFASDGRVLLGRQELPRTRDELRGSAGP